VVPSVLLYIISDGVFFPLCCAMCNVTVNITFLLIRILLPIWSLNPIALHLSLQIITAFCIFIYTILELVCVNWIWMLYGQSTRYQTVCFLRIYFGFTFPVFVIRCLSDLWKINVDRGRYIEEFCIDLGLAVLK
jgi:hypothetical protein